jgi:hypothetical protein
MIFKDEEAEHTKEYSTFHKWFDQLNSFYKSYSEAISIRGPQKASFWYLGKTWTRIRRTEVSPVLLRVNLISKNISINRCMILLQSCSVIEFLWKDDRHNSCWIFIVKKDGTPFHFQIEKIFYSILKILFLLTNSFSVLSGTI